MEQPLVNPVPQALSLPRPAIASTARRLLLFDNLRVVAITMVILQHVGQAYGPTGGEWPIKETQTAFVLSPFFTVNRSFGMSLFFMIAGYFMVISCDRKGAAPFAKDRVLRLGVPVFLWWLLLEIGYGLVMPLLGNEQPHFVWPVEIAHLWFVQYLLIVSLSTPPGGGFAGTIPVLARPRPTSPRRGQSSHLRWYLPLYQLLCESGTRSMTGSSCSAS